MSTRKKIIEAATKVFNEKGFSAVNLLELAQSMGISRGNLTYHFKDKDVLVAAIAGEMWDKIEAEKKKSRQLPSFQNLHNSIQLYYKFQKEYSFIFLDTHLLNHPLIKEQFREMTRQSIEDHKAAIAFAIQLGNMNPEPVKGCYNNLAFTVWMIEFYWLSQQTIQEVKTSEVAEKIVWSLLVPHLTPKGIGAFKKFFGETYYEQLGDPFEADIHSFISF